MADMLSDAFSSDGTPTDPLVPDPGPYDNPDTPDDRGGDPGVTTDDGGDGGSSSSLQSDPSMDTSSQSSDDFGDGF